MTELILTEKYSVASDFAKALGINPKGKGFFKGNGYTITWAVGHLVELLEPQDYNPTLKKWKKETLPILPDTFQYKPIKKTIQQFNTIKRLLTKNKFTRIIIATDAGREGEVIARTTLLMAGFTDKTKIVRFWTSQALTPTVVKTTMQHLTPITAYDRLWRAGYYRQVADWMVGMNLTRLLTIQLNDLYSVGRVQTAVLALLCDRKKERDTFVPEPFWLIKGKFSNDKGHWEGLWFKNKESRIKEKAKADALMALFTGETNKGTVLSVKKETKTMLPPLLFSLTDLQQEANKRFGFTAKKTLAIAQKLYQDKKCLSYPRTDAKVLGTQNLGMTKSIIDRCQKAYPAVFKDLDPKKIALKNKRVFNDAKLTDHHALIPLKPIPETATVDEKNLFDLVLRRFSAAFHPDMIYENTELITEFCNETFKTQGKRIIEPGFRAVYQPSQSAKDPDVLLPPVEKGDEALRQKMTLEEKKTVPPPDYTDSLLLKDMTNPGKYVSDDALKSLYRGEVGIGTQSTRAQMIETLIQRKYVHRVGKKLIALDKGTYLINTLRQHHATSVLTSPEETARWEMTLNDIASGHHQANNAFLTQIRQYVTTAVSEFKNAPTTNRAVTPQKTRPAKRPDKSPDKPPVNGPVNTANNSPSNSPKNSIGKPSNKTDVKCICPLCGGPIIEGKKGFGCANFRPADGGCRFVIWKEIYGKKLTEKNIETLIKGKTTRAYVLKTANGDKFKAKLTLSDSQTATPEIIVSPVEEGHLRPSPVSCIRV